MICCTFIVSPPIWVDERVQRLRSLLETLVSSQRKIFIENSIGGSWAVSLKVWNNRRSPVPRWFCVIRRNYIVFIISKFTSWLWTLNRDARWPLVIKEYLMMILLSISASHCLLLNNLNLRRCFGQLILILEMISETIVGFLTWWSHHVLWISDKSHALL
jgi:hypothetical protein